MDWHWMYNVDRRTKKFVDGLHYFFEVTKASKPEKADEEEFAEDDLIDDIIKCYGMHRKTAKLRNN